MKSKEIEALFRFARRAKKAGHIPAHVEGHLFLYGADLYATDGLGVVNVFCRSQEIANPMMAWRRLDHDMCAARMIAARYADLDACAEDTMASLPLETVNDIERMKSDYFPRFFASIPFTPSGYDCDEVVKVMKVFKAFGIPVNFEFTESHIGKHALTCFHGMNDDYSIRAIIMPLHR